MRVEFYKFDKIRSVGIGMETYDAVVRFWLNVWWWMFGVQIKRRFKR